MPTRKTTPTRKTGSTATATKRKPAAAAKSTKKTSAVARKPAAAKTKKVSDEEVTIDRRRSPRRGEEATVATAAPKLERRQKVVRRRQIDPTTCERDYSDQEVAFMNALDEYKRKNGRMFPTCSEVLEVIRGLGYVQLSPTERAALPVANETVATVSQWDDDAEELDEEID